MPIMSLGDIPLQSHARLRHSNAARRPQCEKGYETRSGSGGVKVPDRSPAQACQVPLTSYNLSRPNNSRRNVMKFSGSSQASGTPAAICTSAKNLIRSEYRHPGKTQQRPARQTRLQQLKSRLWLWHFTHGISTHCASQRLEPKLSGFSIVSRTRSASRALRHGKHARRFHSLHDRIPFLHQWQSC